MMTIKVLIKELIKFNDILLLAEVDLTALGRGRPGIASVEIADVGGYVVLKLDDMRKKHEEHLITTNI